MYIIFGWEEHYPQGGAEDFIACHPNLEVAIAICRGLLGRRAMSQFASRNEWLNILDAESGKPVYQIFISDDEPLEDYYGCEITKKILEA